mmetsp:Transcript_70329/g.205691  ORF Transcript_70329/g.205691 Transcript_70329/m.205691 type:complete len:303 (-) Transcript_70329:44-952(-)
MRVIGNKSREQEALLGKKAALAGNDTHRTLALLAVVPWMLFSATVLIYTMLFHDIPTILDCLLLIALALCIRQSVVNYMRGGSDGAYAMALCTTAIFIGSLVGVHDYFAYMEPYWAFEDRRVYEGVGPEELADAHRDAAAITFVAGSKPDLQASIGYHSRSSIYCVAPIGAWDAGAASREIQFWAAGKDCCEAQGSFSCDDAKRSAAHGGLVIDSADVDKYILAVRTAEVQNGVQSTPEPIFVRWVSNFEAARGTYWNEAWISWLLASLAYLPLSAASVVLAPSALKSIELLSARKEESAGA